MKEHFSSLICFIHKIREEFSSFFQSINGWINQSKIITVIHFSSFRFSLKSTLAHYEMELKCCFFNIKSMQTDSRGPPPPPLKYEPENRHNIPSVNSFHSLHEKFNLCWWDSAFEYKIEIAISFIITLLQELDF